MSNLHVPQRTSDAHGTSLSTATVQRKRNSNQKTDGVLQQMRAKYKTSFRRSFFLILFAEPASCEAFGDPHYRTFDGHLHHYQGRCYYIMARDCLNNDFTVLVQNDQRGHTGVSWTQEVTFNRANVSVTLLQGLRVRANGQVVDLPYIYSPYVYVKLEGGLVAVETDIGVSLMWNGDSIISVSVPSDYAGKMCGLCGNYNGNAFDDQRLRDGRVALDLNEFGSAWQVTWDKYFIYYKNSLFFAQVKRLGDKCDERGGVSDPCKQRSRSHRESAREKCSILLGDVFKPCHGTVDHTQYFYSCMFDVCACARSESHCLCSAIEAYANECAREGVELRGRWRTGPCGTQSNRRRRSTQYSVSFSQRFSVPPKGGSSMTIARRRVAKRAIRIIRRFAAYCRAFRRARVSRDSSNTTAVALQRRAARGRES